MKLNHSTVRNLPGPLIWFGLPFVFLASIIGYIMFWPLVNSWTYEPVDGVIVKSEMEYCGVEVSGYAEQIRFAYHVGNRTFHDGRLRPGPALVCEPKDTVAEILKQYPVGAKVQGWYDPDQPEIAVIKRTPGTMQWMFMTVLAGFLFLFFCIWMIQRSNARRSAEMEQRR